MPTVGTGRTVLVPSEHWEQREFVKWFRQNYTDTRILAIPNGGYRSPSTAARLKAEGVCSGVPDLFIPAWGLWVEMKKSDGGSVSESQKDWHSYLTDCGYRVIVTHGRNDAIKQIEKLRETT